MEDSSRSRPSFRCGDGERNLELVSGRGHYNQNHGQIYPETRPESRPWGFGDPETKRRKRIARYRSYTVEGRIKATIRNGLRWVKNKCSEIIHGY